MKGFTIFCCALAVILMEPTTTKAKNFDTIITELLATVDAIIDDQQSAINTYKNEVYEDLVALHNETFEHVELSPELTEKSMANRADYCVDAARRTIKKLCDRPKAEVKHCLSTIMNKTDEHLLDMEKVLNEVSITKNNINSIHGLCYEHDPMGKPYCFESHLEEYIDTENGLLAAKKKNEELISVRRKQYIAEYNKCIEKHQTYFKIDMTDIEKEAKLCLAAFIKAVDCLPSKESEPQPPKNP